MTTSVDDRVSPPEPCTIDTCEDNSHISTVRVDPSNLPYIAGIVKQ